MGLQHVHKCRPDETRLFVLGDSVYMYGGNGNDLTGKFPRHHTAGYYYASTTNGGRNHLFLTSRQHWVENLTPDVTTRHLSDHNRLVPHFHNNLPHHDGHMVMNDLETKLKDTSDVTVRLGKIESVMSRVSGLIQPIVVDGDREEVNTMQQEDMSNVHVGSCRSSSGSGDCPKPPKARHDMFPNYEFFLTDSKRLKNNIRAGVEGFIWFMNLFIIPIFLISFVVMNTSEKIAKRSGPVSAPSGAAVGRINKKGCRTVEEKTKSGCQYVPRNKASEYESDDEENYDVLDAELRS